MLTLCRDKYAMESYILRNERHGCWAFALLALWGYTPASDKIELIEFLLKLWVQNFAKTVKNREKRKI